MIILNKLLYKPIKRFLTDRQSSIAADLDDAARSKIEAEELLKKQQEEFKKAALEIRKLKEKAKKDADATSDMIIKEARDRERAILTDTEKQLASEKQKVIQAIEGELGDIIASLSSTIIGRKLDEKLDAEMIERLLNKDRERE
jgi:F-type H+-transporting ATPase subunit b